MVARSPRIPSGVRQRAHGCLLGQLIGDALGSQVEGLTPEEIQRLYPNGVRDMADGGSWNTLAGQPTDDSEMALALARTLVRHGRYDPELARRAYWKWLNSRPFDCGNTVWRGLTGSPNPESQANGALMRISPLGIFGAFQPPDELAAWARADAAITHPHPVCQHANALFVLALARAVATGISPSRLYAELLDWSRATDVPQPLRDTVVRAAEGPPQCASQNRGWVLIAFHNALWQLLHASNPEEALLDTVGRGGDPDTNAAICGALMGAVFGADALPARWVDTVLSCRPWQGGSNVHQPRPRQYWPVDALKLADALLAGPKSP